jgi:uncharacterized protein YeaO (DUF488 family)
VAKAVDVQVRRVYDPAEPEDGQRVLVDRLWPRGLSKERARLDDWCKEIAPSNELRKWYGHDPDRYAEFARRYRAELADPERAAALAHLRELAGNGRLTLLTATKRSDISEAAVPRRPARQALTEWSQLVTSPATRLMVVARMTVPKTYDSRQWRSTTERIAVLDTPVSDTW